MKPERGLKLAFFTVAKSREGGKNKENWEVIPLFLLIGVDAAMEYTHAWSTVLAMASRGEDPSIGII